MDAGLVVVGGPGHEARLRLDQLDAISDLRKMLREIHSKKSAACNQNILH
jgi:hypothetical protein